MNTILAGPLIGTLVIFIAGFGFGIACVRIGLAQWRDAFVRRRYQASLSVWLLGLAGLFVFLCGIVGICIFVVFAVSLATR